MTNIEAVTIVNFKGLVKTVKLGQRTILFGPNGAGKSSIMEGIDFALNGEIPGLPKKEGELWAAIASGSTVSTEVEGPGLQVLRVLQRTPRGTTSMTGNVGGRDCKKSEMPLAIEKSNSPEVIDLASFWSLSEPKQIGFLCQYYRGEEYTVEAINNAMPEAARIKDPKVLVRLKDMNQFDLLLALESGIKKEKSEHTATVKGADNSIESLTKQKESIARPAGTLAEIQKEIASLEQTAKQLRLDLSDSGYTAGQYDTWKKEFDEVEARIAELEPQVELAADRYRWEIRRINNEKAKALAKPEKIMGDTLDEILKGMETAGCTACPVTMLIKKKLKQFAGGTVDTDMLDKELASYQGRLDKRLEYDGAVAKKKRLQNDPRSKAVASNDKETREAAEGIQKRLDELREHEKALIRIGDLNASIEKLRLGKVESEKALEEIKKGEKALADLRKKLAGEVFAPVKHAVDRLIPFGTSVFGFDANDKLLIGWQIPNRPAPTPRPSLSGGETALFDSAFALGLISLSEEARPKILMVEAAEMDYENLGKFCEALSVAPENVQILVATWMNLEGTEVNLSGFQVVKIGYGQHDEGVADAA